MMGSGMIHVKRNSRPEWIYGTVPMSVSRRARNPTTYSAVARRRQASGVAAELMDLLVSGVAVVIAGAIAAVTLVLAACRGV